MAVQRNALVAPFSVRDKVTTKEGKLETTHQKWFTEAQQAINGSAQIASNVPTGSNFPGQAGQFIFDANWLYVCVALNHWKRTPIADF